MEPRASWKCLGCGATVTLTAGEGIEAMSDDVMTNPGITVNCPYCGAALMYLHTVSKTHFYRCPRHRVLILPPDGRVRQQPS